MNVEDALRGLIAAVAPLLSDNVSPFYSAWEIDTYGELDLDGEKLHANLQTAYQAGVDLMGEPQGHEPPSAAL